MPKTEVGKLAGNCGFYAEIIVTCFIMGLGMLFDTMGRKLPLVTGFLVAGLSILATPFLKHSIYPGFLMMRILMTLGVIPAVNTPLLPDYVESKSLGLANAYVR